MQIRKGHGLTETSPVLNVDGDPSLIPHYMSKQEKEIEALY